MGRIAAILVAAGRGKRFGGRINKQFVLLAGKPILYHTLCRLINPLIDEIILVVPKGRAGSISRLVKKDWQMDVQHVVEGGEERHHSVWAGLEAISHDVTLVAIHDAVRPFVSDDLIARLLEAGGIHGAAIPGLMPQDTIKERAGDLVLRTLDRSVLVAVQTPQVFKKDLIMRVYQSAFERDKFSTDDAALAEQYGEKVFIVEGEYQNIKITTPEDLLIAESFINQGKKDADRIWI